MELLSVEAKEGVYASVRLVGKLRYCDNGRLRTALIFLSLDEYIVEDVFSLPVQRQVSLCVLRTGQ
jgi:hypothetical protein